MNIDGLTRENVASHLQKYRIQEKRNELLNQMARHKHDSSGFAEPMTMVSSPHPNMMTFKLTKNGNSSQLTSTNKYWFQNKSVSLRK